MRFIPGSGKWYVRHLDKSFFTKSLFNSTVFTPEVLKAMEPIVNDYFRFKSIDEMEEVEKKFNEAIGDETDGFTDSDNLDAGDFFEN
jgi:hypothetical protein